MDIRIIADDRRFNKRNKYWHYYEKPITNEDVQYFPEIKNIELDINPLERYCEIFDDNEDNIIKIIKNCVAPHNHQLINLNNNEMKLLFDFDIEIKVDNEVVSIYDINNSRIIGDVILNVMVHFIEERTPSVIIRVRRIIVKKVMEVPNDDDNILLEEFKKLSMDKKKFYYITNTQFEENNTIKYASFLDSDNIYKICNITDLESGRVKNIHRPYKRENHGVLKDIEDNYHYYITLKTNKEIKRSFGNVVMNFLNRRNICIKGIWFRKDDNSDVARAHVVSNLSIEFFREVICYWNKNIGTLTIAPVYEPIGARVCGSTSKTTREAFYNLIIKMRKIKDDRELLNSELDF